MPCPKTQRPAVSRAPMLAGRAFLVRFMRMICILLLVDLPIHAHDLQPPGLSGFPCAHSVAPGCRFCASPHVRAHVPAASPCAGGLPMPSRPSCFSANPAGSRAIYMHSNASRPHGSHTPRGSTCSTTRPCHFPYLKAPRPPCSRQALPTHKDASNSPAVPMKQQVHHASMS